MTNRAKILRDLRAGQTTASSIAGRIELDQPAVELICQQLVAEGKAESYKLADHPSINVYRLTEKEFQS